MSETEGVASVPTAESDVNKPKAKDRKIWLVNKNARRLLVGWLCTLLVIAGIAAGHLYVRYSESKRLGRYLPPVTACVAPNCPQPAPGLQAGPIITYAAPPPGVPGHAGSVPPPPPLMSAAIAAPATIHAAWTQLVPKDANCVAGNCEPRILLRALIPAHGSCDGLARDAKTNQPVKLSQRDNRRRDRFQIEVCEALLTLEQVGVNLANGSAIRWERLASGPGAISVIGDTGCNDEKAQNCNAVRSWPLARVAAEAAWLNNDLIIHVGDYRYRGRDDWPNWQADFFEPARMLLLAAPWVMLRGNHENCYKENGFGWAFLLSPTFGHVPPCEDSARYDRASIEPAAAIDLKGLRLVTIDSADSRYRCQSWIDTFEQQDRAKLRELLKRPQFPREPQALWLLTHYPVFDVFETEPCPNKKNNDGSTAGFHRLMAGEFAERSADAIISGDSHSLQVHNVTSPIVGGGSANVLQFITGHGGTQLDSRETAEKDLKQQNVTPPCSATGAYVRCPDFHLGKPQGYADGSNFKADARLRFEFGFMTAERVDERSWEFRSRTLPDGKDEFSCRVPATDDKACVDASHAK
ncbi:MAG TPA: metallophosphoesterase [Bradyrhizobium sp.]|jgi:hypothetical protein